MKKAYNKPQINKVNLTIEEMTLSCCKIGTAMNVMGCTNASCVGAGAATAQGNNSLS